LAGINPADTVHWLKIFSGGLKSAPATTTEEFFNTNKKFFKDYREFNN